MTITTCVFDAYGTLFDVSAAARIAASERDREALAERWSEVAAIWRAKQLNYSWLRAVTNEYCDFWKVTQDGLDYALEATGLDGDPELRERLLALYWELQAYREVPLMLTSLKESGLRTGILSNGSPDMLRGAVNSAGLSAMLDAVLSVESVGVFKPHGSVYELVTRHFDCSVDQVLFVSSNGWDAAAASGFGFQTVWVNRAVEPMDRLPWEPSFVVSDLTTIPELANQ